MQTLKYAVSHYKQYTTSTDTIIRKAERLEGESSPSRQLGCEQVVLPISRIGGLLPVDKREVELAVEVC